MILVVFENSQVRSTMETHTLVTLVRIGALEQTGHASLGRTHKETFLETHQHKTITSGTRTQPRLQSQFLTKGQRMETQRNRLMIQPPLRKRTTTVSMQALSQSVCMDKPTVAQQAFNHTSRTLLNVQMAFRALQPETAQATPSDQPMLGGKSTNSHPEVAVQARCHFLLKRWYTSQPTTLVKSTCLCLTHMAR